MHVVTRAGKINQFLRCDWLPSGQDGCKIIYGLLSKCEVNMAGY